MKRRKNNVPFGYYALQPGTLARVNDLANGYSLPAGLEPGDEVVIEEFDCSYVVRKGERQFTIGSGNIESHLDTETGEWIPGACRKNPGDKLAQLRAFTAETKIKYAELIQKFANENEIEEFIRTTHLEATRFCFVGNYKAWEWILKTKNDSARI